MDDPGRIEAGSPWHEGERALQRSIGVADRLAETGPRTIRDHMTEQHRTFYPQLPFVAVGAVDPSGAVWATLLAGRPGFLAAPDPGTLAVAAPRDPGDPADAGLGDGAAVGLLGIELHTRRRNRLNGRLHRDADDGFTVAVRESFGNCPRYIRLRDFRFARDPAGRPDTPAERLDGLDARARAMIAGAETLFVASAYEGRDGRTVDVSHRGGRPGFVRIEADGTLAIPDFAGNGYFNTLGNIHANPKAGLAFVDFAQGDLLQLTGEAEVVLDDPAIAAFAGAERLLRFRPQGIVRRPGALSLRWDTPADGVSPHLAQTGAWPDR